MAIDLICPRCDRNLSLPDESAGQYVRCKHCDGQLWVATTPLPPTTQPSSTSQKTSTAVPPIVEQPQKEKQDTSTANFNSPPESRKVTPPPLAATTAMPDDSHALNSGNMPPTSRVAPPPVTPPPRAGKQSKGRVAEFIATEPSQSRLEPDPGGNLPVLTFSDEKNLSSGKEQNKPGSEWLVLGAILFLLLGSTAVYMYDTENDNQDSQTQRYRDIRNIIRTKYFGPAEGPLQDYQQRLRDAALDHSQGNYSDEAAHYRAVLVKLDMEGNNGSPQGLTGLRDATRNDPSLPSDQELRKLLTELMPSVTKLQQSNKY